MSFLTMVQYHETEQEQPSAYARVIFVNNKDEHIHMQKQFIHEITSRVITLTNTQECTVQAYCTENNQSHPQQLNL